MCSIAKIWKQWKRKSKLQFFLNYNFLHLPNVFWIYLEIVRTYFSSRTRVFTEGIPVAHNGVSTFANTHRRYNVSSLNITILKITNELNWISTIISYILAFLILGLTVVLKIRLLEELLILIRHLAPDHVRHPQDQG